MKQKLNILLADDHDYFLDGLQTDIEKIANVNKILRANNGYEVLEIIENHEIDILISDIEMPKLNGIKTARKIIEKNTNIKIIFLTSYYDIQHIKPLLILDINVILDKENVKNEISEALDAVLNNKTYYSKLINNTVKQIIKGKRKIEQKTAIHE